MVQNRALIFKSVPDGTPVAGKDLVIEVSPFDVDQDPPSGGMTLKTYYVSFDPYLRGHMRPAENKSYVPAFTIGKPIANSSVAKVLKSDTSKLQSGDVVLGLLPVAEYSIIGPDGIDQLQKLDNPYRLDPMLFLGVLGMTGLTAYCSLYGIAKPKRGETIFISSAGGAVGHVVGQLAKREGLTVLGSVGDDAKLAWIKDELGFDDGFNYKSESPPSALKRMAPDGIDIYYDNVGGEQLDAALEALKSNGRIVACGMISQYNLKPQDRYGVKNLMYVVSKSITMRGFVVFNPDMGPVYHDEHQKNLQKWIHEGTFKSKQSVTDGIENAVDGLLGMLQGKNFGKAVLKIDDLNHG